MIKASRRGIVLICSAWAFGWGSQANAQLAPPPPPSSNTPPTAAMMMNPFFNPYMNPVLNPAAPQQKMGVGNSLLYLYSAQAARGGIGSGRLSNPGTQTRKRPAVMPNSASVPGGAAAKYFNNSMSGGKLGLGQYYNTRNGRFQNTGN